MRQILGTLSALFSAGCAGGLANSVTVWLCGKYGLTSALGVKIAPALTPYWLYPRVIWGGIWGALFILPFLKNKVVSRGILFSLFPTAVQLYYVFPYMAGKGVMGIKLGGFTPLFVLAFNAVWGITTALWLRSSR